MQTVTIPLPARRATPTAWTPAAIEALFRLPFPELMHRAQTVHREQFDASEIQLSSLLSIKTGGCPEDCAYCPQSAHHDTELEADKLMPVADVVAAARAAQANGAQRFCMGAAWRSPKPHHLEQVAEMIRAGVADEAIPHIASDVAGRVTVSIGVAALHPTALSEPAELVAAADVALYHAKQHGRNRTEVRAQAGVAGV